MAVYAHIKDGTVVNISLWDGKTPVNYPKDMEIVDTEELPIGVGDKYNNGVFYCKSTYQKDEEGNAIWIDVAERRADKNERNRLLINGLITYEDLPKDIPK